MSSWFSYIRKPTNCISNNTITVQGQTLSQEDFEERIRYLIWFTYRSGFSPIGNSGLTSDKGWGCMHRSGQMLLSETIIHHFYESSKSLEKKEKEKIILLFQDNEHAIFSLHSIASFGQRYGTSIGSWFGPGTMVNVINDLILHSPPINSQLKSQEPNFAIYSSTDSALYLDQIEQIAKNENLNQKNENSNQKNEKSNQKNENSWKSLLILVHLRLGLNCLNPLYLEKLKNVFKLQQFLGFLGGKPQAASFFVAIQGDDVYYLDPHIVQNSSLDLSTYECTNLPKTPLTFLDPSLALAFYCKDKKSFEKFWHDIEPLTDPNFEDSLFSRYSKTPSYLLKEKEQKEILKKEVTDLEMEFVDLMADTE